MSALSAASAPTPDILLAQAEMLAQLNAATAARQTVILEGVVNGQAKGSVLALVERGETLALEISALRSWRLSLDGVPTFNFDGSTFVAVSDLPGTKANIEQKTQRIFLSVPAALFRADQINLLRSDTPPLAPSLIAGFLNYTFFGYRSSGASYGSAFLESGISSEAGALITTGLVNSRASPSRSRVIRYDTAWRSDDRDGLRTWTLGDSITFPGAWGRSVRFGGIQFGSNFQLRPDLVTFPLQAFSGTAVVPSTVDIFVNGNQVATQPVQPGPFAITDVPLITGAGDVQLVVRDQFGQQQIITQAFYASRRLLRAGLDDYQLSLGAVRENYGLKSHDYGRPVGSGYWRRGLTDATTVEGRFEADDVVRALGSTVDQRLGLLGIASTGVALSDGPRGAGQLWIAGYEYQGRAFNFGARSMVGSSKFQLVGDRPDFSLARQSYVSAGFNLGTAGSVGIAWAEQRIRSLPSMRTLGVSYSALLPGRAYLSASVSRSAGFTATTSAFITISVPLDSRTSVGTEVSTARTAGHDSSLIGVSAQRAMPTDQGFGYRIRATTQEQVDAGLNYGWRYGEYLLEGSRYKDINAARLTATGGIGVADGHPFLSRRINDSFGIVRVGDIEGVRVFHGGNPIGRTDANGVLVLPALTSYSSNRITIEDRDLPMDVRVKSRDISVVPQFRSGALIDYQIRRHTGAILVLQTGDGRPLPSGVGARSLDNQQVFVVGANGEVFVDDLASITGLIVEMPDGRRCMAEVAIVVPLSSPLPSLGPFACRDFPK
jgi:outer membrane usher protein